MLLPYKIELPLRRPPRATYFLIGINTILFLIFFFMGAAKQEIICMQWGFIPEEWSRLYTLLSSMFLHGGWMHLISNMYFLWLFGRAIEDKLGIGKYIIFYLVTGIVGSITHLLTIPGFFSDVPCIGASGAISGILGAFIVLAPYAKVRTCYFFLMFLRPLYGIVEIPSLLFVGGWFLMQLIYALSTTSVMAVPVAYWAHIGGFLFGAIAVGAPKIYQQTRTMITQWSRQREFLQAMRLAGKSDWAEACGILEKLKTSATEIGDLNILLSQAYFRMGDMEKAGSIAGTVLRDVLQSKNPAQTITAYYALQGMGSIEGLEPHDYLVLGRAFSKYQKMDQAKELLVEGLRKFPENPEADLLLYELGDIHLHVNDEERAREIYTLLLESYPDSRLYGSAEYCLRELEDNPPSIPP